MHTHHKHDDWGTADPKEWLKDVTDVEGEELEKIRKIPQKWDETKWEPFPDAGVFQMTRLTKEVTNGSCNSYYIKMKSGEVFPVHKHPNAVHIMIGIQGEGSICWRENKNEPKYRTTIKPGSGVFGITPETEHAILADRGQEIIFLVVNAPAENIHKHDYQVHVHNHEDGHDHDHHH